MSCADDIFTAASELLGGGAPEGMERALRAMCEAAEAELCARLREGVAVPDIERLFVTAAGVLALSMYIQAGDLGDEATVKVGSLSVSRRGAASARASAANLRKQAETMLASYLADRGFGFLGVRA